MVSSTSSPQEVTTSRGRFPIYSTPKMEQKMSITQIYLLAYRARSKLSQEAAQADYDLRLLVGNANMLDSLMINLANTEQEQERWFK